MPKLAIVGSGIAGLGLAHYLSGQYEIFLFDKNDYAGGHSNTILLPENDRTLAVDTGFMVFNHVTYPLLTRLFAELEVPCKMTDMSFSVQQQKLGLEFSGASWNRLFGDRRNILNLRFWKMLLQLDRFNKEAVAALAEPETALITLADYVKSRAYGDDFLHFYLLPMCSAVWSAPPEKMLEFPAVSLLRFFHNHGFLGMDTQHQWWTVEGGARVYVSRILKGLTGSLHLSKKLLKAKRQKQGVLLSFDDGSEAVFDKLVLACHADEAMAVLEDAGQTEKNLLSAFKYQHNSAVLHTDSSIMPHAKPCWSSWNYLIDKQGQSSTHYWMNKLQGVSKKQNYFVSLNADDKIDDSKILKRMNYHHPLFDLDALSAQKDLHSLNLVSSEQQVYFAGSYFAYGFHEDALRSAWQLANVLSKNLVAA